MTQDEFSAGLREACRQAGGKAAHAFFQANNKILKASAYADWDFLSPVEKDMWSLMDDTYTDAFMEAASDYFAAHQDMVPGSPESDSKPPKEAEVTETPVQGGKALYGWF